MSDIKLIYRGSKPASATTGADVEKATKLTREEVNQNLLNLKTAASPVWVTPPYNAGNFTASGAMTWDVAAGDVETYQYTLSGKTMTVNFVLNTTTVGGTPAALLYVKIPAGATAAKTIIGPLMRMYDNDVPITGFIDVVAGSDQIRCWKTTGNWAAAANTTYVYGTLTFEIN